MPRATIIMATFNKAAYLALTLESLTQQTQTDFELILVDDGSTDATASVVERFSNRLAIRYVKHEHRGRPAACNAGLDMACTDSILFCDDDRLMPPDFVQRHLCALADEHNHNIVVVGWKKTVLTLWQRDRLPLTADDLQRLRSRHPTRMSELEGCDTMQLLHEGDVANDFSNSIAAWCVGDEMDNFHVPAENESPVALPWLYGTTGNLSVRSAQLGKLIRFDERYVGWGMEDTDLSYQLHLAGATFKLDTGIVNFHQIHPTGPGKLEDNAKARWRDLANNYRHFRSKYDRWDTLMIWATLGRLKPAQLQALAREADNHSESLLVEELTWAYRELYRLRQQDPATTFSLTPAQPQAPSN